MGVTIKVDDVVREMEVLSPTLTVYLNRRTGEFVGVSEDDIAALKHPDDVPDWMRDHLPKVQEAVQEESEDYVSLPDSFDIHEWEIMRDFARSVSSADASDELLRALHGKGAFRYFRDRLHGLGLVDEWYKFRLKAFERIAIEWLEASDIPYTMGQSET